MTALGIPVDVDDLTAAWCTYAVQERAPGAVVTNAEVIDAHSGTTGRARIALTCDDQRVPASLFAKLPPFNPESRAFVDAQGMGVAEARFYAALGCEIPVVIPAVWHAATDDDGRYIMLLEDLSRREFREPASSDNDFETTVNGVIDNLAVLHAAYWASSRFDDGGDLEWLERRSRNYGSAGGYVQHAVNELGGDMPPASRELAAFYLEHVDAIAALLASGPRTLVHGDAHLGNMWVDERGVGFLDWAVSGHGVGMRDVAYFIGNSVSSEFRCEHERRLVHRYTEALAARGIALDTDAAWDAYRYHMVSPWIAAVVTASFGSAMQPIEIGMRAVARSDRSIVDLDTLALLASLV